MSFRASDRASFQVKENGVAQAAVQTAAPGRGGLFQNDAPVQHPHVMIPLIYVQHKESGSCT